LLYDDWFSIVFSSETGNLKGNLFTESGKKKKKTGEEIPRKKLSHTHLSLEGNRTSKKSGW